MRFLSIDNVIELHRRTIEKEGGSPGIRDRGLLDSAVSAPQQSWGGEYLHTSVVAMAAAYLYHIVQNHPFVDGNKRTGSLALLFFCRYNGLTPLPEPEDLESVTMLVASGKLDKDGVTQWLEGLFPGL